MTGVNDLIHEWIRDGDYWAGGITGAKEVLGDELIDVARTAWHPASQPPTQEDGNRFGMVLYAACKCGEWHVWEGRWHGADNDTPSDCWARIRDVVLLPPEDE